MATESRRNYLLPTKVSPPPNSSGRESDLPSPSNFAHWNLKQFRKLEKSAPHLSKPPRSFLRAHTNKREPSSEGASFDGGFEMALTAAEALAAAGALVDDFCTDPPAEVRIAAIARLSNWLRSSPDDGTTTTTHGDQSGSWKPSSRAMLDSGASQILAPWRRPRARLIEAAE